MDIKQELKSIYALNEEAAQKELASMSLRREAQTKLEGIASAISNNDISTGNKILDFVIVVHTTTAKQYLHWYEEFKREVQKNLGRCALIVIGTQERTGLGIDYCISPDHDGNHLMSPPDPYEWVYELRMGILKDEGLILSSRIKQIVFDTKDHMRCKNGNVERIMSSLHIPMSEICNLSLLADAYVMNKSQHSRYYKYGGLQCLGRGFSLEVAIGDKAIMNWASTFRVCYSAQSMIEKMAKELSYTFSE